MRARSFAKNESPVLSESTRQRLGSLLGKKKASQKSTKKSPPKAFGLTGGSALGPLSEGAYWIACARGDADKAKEALEAGAMAWSLQKNGREAELFALSHGDQMVAVLEAAGSPPSAWIEQHGPRALEMACEAKGVRSVQWLIQQGASAQALGPSGKPPLAIAFSRRWPEGARMLLQAGAALHPMGGRIKSWETLLESWRQFLNHGLGPDAQVLLDEWVRRGHPVPSPMKGATPSKTINGRTQRQHSERSEKDERTEASTILQQPLLPGMDWGSTPAPGEIAAALKKNREQSRMSAKSTPKKSAKKPF